MKREYDSPRAEKVDFDYTETVVASNGNGEVYNNDAPGSGGWICECNNSWHEGSWGDNCKNGEYT